MLLKYRCCKQLLREELSKIIIIKIIIIKAYLIHDSGASCFWAQNGFLWHIMVETTDLR